MDPSSSCIFASAAFPAVCFSFGAFALALNNGAGVDVGNFDLAGIFSKIFYFQIKENQQKMNIHSMKKLKVLITWRVRKDINNGLAFKYASSMMRFEPQFFYIFSTESIKFIII